MTEGHPEQAFVARPPTPAESRSYRRLFADRSFRRLWFGQTVSGIGDWLVIGLLIPLVTQLSGGSSFAVAGIMIAKIIPSLFLGSVIGALLDRFDRKRVMIVCDLVRSALILGLVFTNELALIYFVVFASEVASLFFVPAKNALIPELVAEEDVAAANGLSYTTQQASMLVGLTASGAILAVFERAMRALLAADPPVVGRLAGLFAPELLGPRAGVFLDSLTFLISAAFILGIQVRTRARPEGGVDLSLVGRDVVEAFRFLGGHRELRGFLLSIGLAILGGGAIIPVGLIYVQQNLTGTVPFLDQVQGLERLTAAPQTFILVFLAVGMVAGALVVPRLLASRRIEALFLAGIAGFGLSMLGFASVGLYWLASLFAVGAGFFLAEVSVTGNTYIVHAASDELRGRVFTALEAVVRTALLLSMLVTAPLGDIVGGLVRRVVTERGIAPADVVFTGSRLTLQFASLIVLAAAAYAYRTVDWKGTREDGS